MWIWSFQMEALDIYLTMTPAVAWWETSSVLLKPRELKNDKTAFIWLM